MEKKHEKNDHIGIRDVPLISFGDNLYSRLYSEKIPNLNDTNDKIDEK